MKGKCIGKFKQLGCKHNQSLHLGCCHLYDNKVVKYVMPPQYDYFFLKKSILLFSFFYGGKYVYLYLRLINNNKTLDCS